MVAIPNELSVDLSRTAVLCMDVQVGVVSAYVKDEALIPRAARVLERARRAGLPIVHVRVGFRPGVPEASPRNTFLSVVKASPPHQRFFRDESGAIHPGLALHESDLIVTKAHVSAFAGTDLDLLLRAHDINSLILFGIATGGVVLSTALQAADMDYRVIVIRDCCADLDADVHASLVDNVFPRYGTVVASDDVVNRLAP